MTEIDDKLIQKQATRASFATRLFLVAVACMWLPAPIVTWKVLTIAQDLDTATSKIAANTSTTRSTQKSTQSVLDLLLDCTDPEGDCAKQGRAQTAETVGSINAAQIASVKCGLNQVLAGADRIDYPALLACVGRTLDEQDPPER